MQYTLRHTKVKRSRAYCGGTALRLPARPCPHPGLLRRYVLEDNKVKAPMGDFVDALTSRAT